MSSLLFDIGGTNLRMAVGDSGKLHSIEKIPTPKDPQDAIDALVEHAHKNISTLQHVAGGIASVTPDGIILSSEHLPGWNGFDFKSALGDALGVTVHITNDAELAGLGEATFGAGKEYALVAYIGIGTGIGGSHIANRAAVPHVQGFEPGRQILETSTGETFEDFISGYSLEKRYGKPAKDLPREIYDQLVPILAAGLYNVILEWSPEVLVLGGSLMNESNGFRMSDIEAALAAIPNSIDTLPALKKAELGDDNGLYGALALAG